MQSGTSRKVEDATPNPVLFITTGAPPLQFQRLRFSRASANSANSAAAFSKKRKRLDGSAIDATLAMAFRIVVAIRSTQSGLVECAAVSAPILVRGQNPGRYNSRSSPTVASPESYSPVPVDMSKLSPGAPAQGAGAVWSADPAHAVLSTPAAVGIGLQPHDVPKEQLEVRGNVVVTGAIFTPSDERIKQNITPLDTNEMLENVASLDLHQYEYKDRPGKQVRGVIAQEVGKIIPHSVEEIDDPQGDSSRDRLLVVNDRALIIESSSPRPSVVSLCVT